MSLLRGGNVYPVLCAKDIYSKEDIDSTLQMSKLRSREIKTPHHIRLDVQQSLPTSIPCCTILLSNEGVTSSVGIN